MVVALSSPPVSLQFAAHNIEELLTHAMADHVVEGTPALARDGKGGAQADGCTTARGPPMVADARSAPWLWTVVHEAGLASMSGCSEVPPRA
jgi:hypothetical protein